MDTLSRSDTAFLMVLISIMAPGVTPFALSTIVHNGNFSNEQVEENLVHFNDEENYIANSSLESISAGDVERMSREYFQLPELLEKLLQSNPFYSSLQAGEKESQVAPNNDSSTSSPTLSPPGLLSRLFSGIVFERPSLFRVQFYNSDLEDGSPSPDGNNSTEPKAVFGSPLCLGVCVPVQVFAENTTVRVLSNKRLLKFPPRRRHKPKPTSLPTPITLVQPAPFIPPPPPPPPPPGDYTKIIINITQDYNNQFSQPNGISVTGSDPDSIVIDNPFIKQTSKRTTPSTPTASTVPLSTISSPYESVTDDSALEWLHSWIITPPSLSKIQDRLRLPQFPKIPEGVSDLFVG